MKILKIKQTLPDVVQITMEGESAFFLRKNYLKIITPDLLSEGLELTEEDAADIFNSALIYSAECAAMTYLARAEQSRFGLTQKLIHKGIDKRAVNEALDYLENIKYLDDKRFAAAWLRTRLINHAEGRIKLSAELASRGIKKDDADFALDEFFENINQKELCRKAYLKCIRQKLDNEKTKSNLLRNGFSLSDIKYVLEQTFS